MILPNDVLKTRFARLSTALIADACVRLTLPIRAAPPTLQALIPGSHGVGRAVPVRHYGSVDIFLDVLETAQPGDVLVIDNGGRMDEACIGDLVVLEAQAAGIAAIVVWGLHRDTTDLLQIGVPVFSLGRFPVGPLRLDSWDDDARQVAHVGNVAVTRDDLIFADDDGVVVVAAELGEQVLHTAHTVWVQERHQAVAIREGTSLRNQVQFQAYRMRRQADPSFTFRQHLRQIGGAIEE